MSFWMEDAAGEWVGDFASNRGLEDIRNAGYPGLKQFLEAGEADTDLAHRIIEELATDPELAYIAEMLSTGTAPFYITDGVGDVEGDLLPPR